MTPETTRNTRVLAVLLPRKAQVDIYGDIGVISKISQTRDLQHPVVASNLSRQL